MKPYGCMAMSPEMWRPLTFALNGASKGAQRRLRASVFERAVRCAYCREFANDYQAKHPQEK